MSTKAFSFLLLILSFAVVPGCHDSRADGSSDQSGTWGGQWSPTDSETELYTYSNAVVPSQYYNVRVNGENAFVIPALSSPQGSQPDYEHQVCTFGCSGEVIVEVLPTSEHITEAVVLPKSKNYEYQIVNDVLQLRMSPGDRAVVEINGKEDNDLFLFANPIESEKPSETDPDVMYFRSGTVTDVSAINLKSGMTVYIEGGAVITGRITCEENTSDIAVRGYGILDSRGVNARAIQFHKVNDVVIDGIVLLNDINWSTFIADGENIDISNYKVIAVYNPENSTGCENDAIDLLGCRNARVTGCFGYAHDDVFCVKSRKWSYRGEVEDIVFDDCIAWNHRSGNSFIIGAEVDDDVTGVTFRNCVSIRSAGNTNLLNRGGLSVHNCASGHVSDILFENIVLEDCREYGIHLDIRESYVGNLGNDENNNAIPYSPGTCDGITLRNIDILKAPAEGNFAFGYDEDHQISNLIFSNVRQEGVLITESNITTYFSPDMYYSRNGKVYWNLTNIQYSFE